VKQKGTSPATTACHGSLVSLGISEIAVSRRPRIAILSTGEELVSLPAVTKEHLVKDANGPFLETALPNLGVEAQFWSVIGDDGGFFVELVSNKASTRERRRPHQHRQVRSWS
jgi:molybdopterin biosynthesis enzyme